MFVIIDYTDHLGDVSQDDSKIQVRIVYLLKSVFNEIDAAHLKGSKIAIYELKEPALLDWT